MARAGFTLIEVLVVVSIIGILVAVLAVAVNGLQRGAMIANTKAFIETLEQACVNYREKHGVGRDYPPMDQSGPSSKNLVYYLTRKYTRTLAQAGAIGINLPTVQDSKPILVMDESRLAPTGAIIDFWERPIEYYNSGSGGSDNFTAIPGHSVANTQGSVHIDIVSEGPYAGGTDPDGKDCHIANFKKQAQ
jgi:prepilin-type N-terminal cleavage/methylation domain-containing protein